MPIRDYIQKNNPAFDVHTHIFCYEHIPSGFLGIRLPFHPWFLQPLEKTVGFLSKVFPCHEKRDELRNTKNFVDMFNDKSSMEIFEHWLDANPNTIACVLMMDMTMSVKGKMQKSVVEQMLDLKEVRDDYPNNLLPFVALDPNNPDCLKNFDMAFSGGFGFTGVKIYPSLGYLPSHPVLMSVFDKCEKLGIPVTAHCSSASVKAQYKKLRLIGKKCINGKIVDVDEVVKYRTKEDWQQLNAPQNWIPVLEAFPKLRLNLAHFAGVDWGKFVSGDNNNWVIDIIRMMDKYENFYSDFSYTFTNPEYASGLKWLFALNPKVLQKTLFGSDFFMCQMEGDYVDMRNKFVESLGEKIYNKIARENPKKFLNLE